jgi:hypothetical protein
MKAFGSRLAGGLKILIVWCLIIEVAATAWQTLSDGHFTPARDLFAQGQNDVTRRKMTSTGCTYVDGLFPHPFLGFVTRADPPCGATNINRRGFSNDEFPDVKRTDAYVILLTGSSVAHQLAQYATRPAPRHLELELNRHYVSPNGKPFLVLNGADGAWKQPQQLILFSMYSTTIDAVVTLDGVNEAWSFRPGSTSRLELPSTNFNAVNPLVDESFGDAAVAWFYGRASAELAGSAIFSHSHAAAMLARVLDYLAKETPKSATRRDRRTTVFSLFRLDDEIIQDYEKFYQVQLGLWQGYQTSIEAIARWRGVKAAYFLQAVPAYGKALTEDEKRDAGDLSYAPLYRRVVTDMMTLRDKGLAIYDLGNIFENEKGRIYADDAHCLIESDGTSRGYSIMAEQIAARLAEAWGLQRKP